ncbi:hypothetical protein AGR1_19680 [Agrobacterium sp. B1(2019)]|nr:hypothetical protein AGR1_19680 [Agrobacterium sp. B1(2019)]
MNFSIESRRFRSSHMPPSPSEKFFSKKVLAKSGAKKIDKNNFYLFILRERLANGSDHHANRQKSGSDCKFWRWLVA